MTSRVEAMLLIELGVIHASVGKYLEDGDREELIDDMSESQDRLDRILKLMWDRGREDSEWKTTTGTTDTAQSVASVMNFESTEGDG